MSPLPATRRVGAAPAPAFVLHRYDWSESSLILDLFMRDRGRLAVAAKGAKRPHSQLRPVLLPFQRLLVSLGRAPRDDQASEIRTLRTAEWAGGAPMPGGEALFAGFYLNELLMKLLAREDPHPLLFDAYAATLPALAVADEFRAQAGLRAFELTLLREIGLLPDLTALTQTQQAVAADERHALRPQTGVVRAAHDEPALSGSDLVQLQAALEHGHIEALQLACMPCLAALRGQLRVLLHYHLGSPPLRTRQVLLEVQRLTHAAPAGPLILLDPT